MRYTNSMMKQLVFLLAISASITMSGREKQKGENDPVPTKSGNQVILDACTGAIGSQELWVNNVRAIVFSAGDMWWDLFGGGNAYYYVPAVKDKSQGISSLFAGSIWIGGYDAGGQLKVAAMTYRQTGYDFWPGPLDTSNASTNSDICNAYDKLFYMSRREAEDVAYGLGSPSDNVKKWPGNGDVTKGHDVYLAPFKDVNGDGYYEPTAGDYPDYDVFNKAEKDNLGVCKARLYGDATLWWVFNDKGNIHSETGSAQSIGLEIRAQAFGFKTNDEINNMTFYNYEVINRSSFSLNKTYFTVWTDADLGCYLDDYVGCDINRGLGFIYNSKGVDQLSCSGTNSYGDYPPAAGCDFFKGPLADAGDGIDNDFDGATDEIGETIGMAKFIYYNNNIGAFPAQTTNPAQASHFYGYMTGFWKDGSAFTDGGNAYGGSTPTNYVYPGDPYTGTGWTETAAGNLAGDRRFLQSAGPFTLKPGARNNVTFGLPWAQTAIKNANLFSIALLRIADDKAQALFDNCFKLVDGPEAPDMTIQESNNELFIYLSNKPISNNWLNQYKEKDPLILPVAGQTLTSLANPDQYYRFEGYKIYQVKDNSVSQTDVDDATKAKLVFQCDVKNGVNRIINYSYDGVIGSEVPKIKVEGADNGIVTTFRVNEDAFATGTNKTLVNNKTYYFMAFAYAYNSYCKYKPDTDPGTNPTENYYGQKKPYLEGRKVKKASGIPHFTNAEKDGTITQSVYGYGPKITRIEGQGNGGNAMDLTQETVDKILASTNGIERYPTYENTRGPVKIKVVDPLNIPNAEFTIKFLKLPASTLTASNPAPINWTGTLPYKASSVSSLSNSDSTTWLLTNVNTGESYQPNKAIKIGEEYYFSKIGMSLNIGQVLNPGETYTTVTTGTLTTTTPTGAVSYQKGDLIESSITFANPLTPWLSGIVDSDLDGATNWIRCGTKDATPVDFNDYKIGGNAAADFIDPDKVFGNVVGGTWAPYCLAAAPTKTSSSYQVVVGPGYKANPYFASDPKNFPEDVDPRFISSVDIVITPDKSKWTRCIVIETQTDPSLAEGGARYFSLRKHKSVDKDGNTSVATGSSNVQSDANYISDSSMSWFPGYAINIETGERLNMAFGEDSYNYACNGNDMLWNPTTRFQNNNYDNSFGGRHYLYVFGHGRDGVYKNDLANSPYNQPLDGKAIGAGRYDGGKQMYEQWKFYSDISYNTALTLNSKLGAACISLQNVMRDAMWVSIPVTADGSSGYFYPGFKNPKDMPCEVKVKIRVKKPYSYGFATQWSSLRSSNNLPVFLPGQNPLTGFNWRNTTWTPASTTGTVVTPSTNYLPIDTTNAPVNANMPMYKFSTSDIYAQVADASTLKNAMDLIKVVPNPYYGYSTYEAKRLDTRVRITNLPNKCTIKIFSMNGTLVRTYKRDVSGQEDQVLGEADGETFQRSKRLSYLDWDLKNQFNVPIASGLYIIHIDAGDAGEKILKWFGVMRPQDLVGY